MKAPANNSKPKVLCPRGPQLCRCVQVVDLGTQHFGNEKNGSRKIYIGFETSVLRHTFKDENGPEPFMLQVEFAWYMTGANKTKLRTFIEKWFGKSFPSDQAAGDFDFSKLLNYPAILTVAHTPKTDGTLKATIADIYAPEKGTVTPSAVNPLVCYEVANGQDGKFAMLPEFLRKKIAESDEFKGIAPAPTHEEPEAHHESPTEPDVSDLAPDEIPF